MMNCMFGDNNCGCNHNCNTGCNKNYGCNFNLGGTSSCRVLIYLVVLYVLFNCGIFNWGLDLCTLLILLLFICCFCKNKSCK